MKELAELLKNERLDRNLSVEALSRFSGISASMLESFESFDFERFGASILLRNTVRAYCNALHLDAEPLIQKYASQIEACSLQDEGIRRYGRLQKTLYKRRRMIALPMLVFFLASASVYYGGVWISKRRSKLFAPPDAKRIFSQESLPSDLERLPASAAKPKPAPEAEENGVGKATAQSTAPVQTGGIAATEGNTQSEAAPEILAPNGNGTLTQVPPGDSNEALAGEGPVQNAEANTLNRFTVQAVSKVWIQVKIDGQKIRSEMLRPGECKEFVAAKSMDVVIGNAAGVNMQWNGQPLNAPRVSGRVLRFQLPDYANPTQG
ncbi:MAG: helix-turn-helix domain-containing protein [Syntrophobacteraceae bacterium]